MDFLRRQLNLLIEMAQNETKLFKSTQNYTNLIKNRKKHEKKHALLQPG